MPFKLTWAERQIFLHHAWGPGPLLDMFSALGFKAVSAAAKLGLFTSLEKNGAQTIAELAVKIGADERGVGLLLRVLQGLGYVRRAGKSRYVNSAMTRAWMLPASPVDCSLMMGYFEDACERWSMLDASLRRGAPVESCDKWLDRHPGSWERYHAGMNGIARLVSGEIVARCALPAFAKRLIDLGGSHGLYSIKFCEKNPALNAVVFDWPQARPAAERTIHDHGMSKRVRFAEGDFFRDDIGAGYDAALLFNVIRIFPERDVLELLSKVRAALNPGGIVLVADQFNTRTSSAFSEANGFIVLLELFNGCSGYSYTASQTGKMLDAAGFSGTKEIPLRRAGGISVVRAVRGT